jgi:hypothetical protein
MIWIEIMYVTLLLFIQVPMDQAQLQYHRVSYNSVINGNQISPILWILQNWHCHVGYEIPYEDAWFDFLSYFVPTVTGCSYKGTVHPKGDQWTDGCDLKCTCPNDQSGMPQCVPRYHQICLLGGSSNSSKMAKIPKSDQSRNASRFYKSEKKMG